MNNDYKTPDHCCHVDQMIYGFGYGPMKVVRVASNNGKDKKKVYSVIRVEAGEDIYEITATKDGLSLSRRAR